MVDRIMEIAAITLSLAGFWNAYIGILYMRAADNYTRSLKTLGTPDSEYYRAEAERYRDRAIRLSRYSTFRFTTEKVGK